MKSGHDTSRRLSYTHGVLRYAITDGTCPADGEAEPRLAGQVRAWAAGGVDFALLREKTLPWGVQVRLLRAMVAVAGGSGLRVLVSGRADLARAGGAAGVHLGAGPGELSPAEVRQVLPGALVSVSCHTPEEVRRAQGAADLILFAPVFGKVVRDVRVADAAGLPALASACRASRVPVLALGGVTGENTAECLHAGAAGVAGIRLFR